MGLLKVTLFHTKPVALVADQVWKRQIAAGNTFLAPHGISYDVYPMKGSIQLDYDTVLASEGRGPPGKQQRDALRMAAHVAYSTGDGRLPAILCQIGGGGGESPGTLGFHSDWMPYVVMDSATLNPDGLTLTHEAGHCAGLRHPWDEPRLGGSEMPDNDNLMSYGVRDITNGQLLPRTLIQRWQLDAIRAAYFHYG
jgi:hypothetical protein